MAKMKNALASKQSGQTTVGRMSGTEQQALKGLSINEAFARGIITDLGDSKGNFIKWSTTATDAAYAIVNNKAVRVSQSLLDNLETIHDEIGDLVFYGGISTIEGEGKGKEFFRLGRAQGYNLTDENAVQILDLVEAE